MKFVPHPYDNGYDCYKCSVLAGPLERLINPGNCFADTYGVDWLCPDCHGHCLKAYDHRFYCKQEIVVEHLDGTTGVMYGLLMADQALVAWHMSTKPAITHPANLKVRCY